MRGRSLIAEFWECSPDVLDSVEAVTLLATRALKALGAAVTSASFQRSPAGGVAGAAFSGDAHVAIHTEPQRGYAAADLYVADGAAPLGGHRVLATGLQAARWSLVALDRGADAPDGLRVTGCDLRAGTSWRPR